MGRSCRKRHGYKSADASPDWTAVQAFLGPHRSALALPERWDGDVRRLANVLVHRIAVEQDGTMAVACCDALRALGFRKLGNRVAARMSKIRIWEEPGEVVLRAPFSDGLFGIPGRRWDKENEVTRVKVHANVTATKRLVLAALTRAFPGALVDGPKGLFVLPTPATGDRP